MYKFYIPLTLLAGFIIDGLILGFEWWTNSRYILLLIVLPVGFIPILLNFEYRVKTLCVVGDAFFISSFFKETEFQLSEIVEFRKSYKGNYLIVFYRDGKCMEYKIIPYAFEEWLWSMRLMEITSIEKFRKSLMGQIKGNRKRLLGG